MVDNENDDVEKGNQLVEISPPREKAVPLSLYEEARRALLGASISLGMFSQLSEHTMTPFFSNRNNLSV